MSIYKEHIEDWDKEPESEGEEKFPNGTWIEDWLNSPEADKVTEEYFKNRPPRVIDFDDFDEPPEE